MAPENDVEQPGTTGEESLVLKPVSPVLRRRLEKCFEHGNRLSHQDKTDYDYAHTMFTECVANDPGCLRYVEALLDNLQRKYKNNKRGARFGGVNKGPFKKAVQKKDWPQVLRLGLDVLKTNPWDVPTLRAMAEACAAYHPHLNEVELRYLKNALDANPKDPEVNRHCARSLARMGQFDQAIACWRRVEEARPDDPEARKNIAVLMVDKTRQRVQIEDDSLTEEEKAKRRAERAKQMAEQQAKAHEERAKAAQETKAKGETRVRREIPLTPRQKLEKALAENPHDMENYVALMKLLEEEGRKAEVPQVLQKAVHAAGGDVAAQQKLIDYQLRNHRRQLAVAVQRAQTEKTDDAVGLVKQFKAELNRLELELYAALCERFPEEMPLKFELAMRLKRAENYTEAIKVFDILIENRYRLAAVHVERGDCLLTMKQYKLAGEAYQKAIDAAKTAADVEYRKLAMYRSAWLAEGMKKYHSAESYYTRLYEFDPDYKDVRTRLDKVREKLKNR